MGLVLVAFGRLGVLVATYRPPGSIDLGRQPEYLCSEQPEVAWF